MKLKIYLITMIIAVLGAVAAYFVDYRVSLGILFSASFSLLNMILLSISMKAATSGGQLNYSVLILVNIIRFVILAAVIYIAIRNPQTFNMVGVAIGFTLFLFALVADAGSRKGGGTL